MDIFYVMIFLNKKFNKCTFEFTLRLQRFQVNLNKNIFIDLFMKCYLNFVNIVNSFFVNYNNLYEYIIE